MTEKLPYRSTPIFTHDSLPTALRQSHSTKAGVWGVLKVLKGSLLFSIEGGEGQIIDAPDTVLIVPQQLHSVTPIGDMRMQVDFYHQRPIPN